MVQLDYQRLDNLLNYLISLNTPIKLEELSKILNVSTRTLRSDIKQINDHILDYGASISLIRKEGYHIEYRNKRKFDDFWFHKDSGTFLFTSADSRIKFLLRIFLMSDQYYSQEYLLTTLFVSQNTLFNDLKTLKNMLNPYQLKIKNKSNIGYKICGSEQNIRDAINRLIFKDDLYSFITGNSSVIRDVCNNIDFKKFSTIFENFFCKLDSLESDFFKMNIFSYILLTVSRIKDGNELEYFEVNNFELRDSVKIELLKFIERLNKEFNLQINRYDQDFIIHIISENFPNLIDDSQQSKENLDLATKIVEDMLEDIENFVADSWVKDSTMKEQLINHILRVLKIHTIDGNRVNPILESVKNNFPYSFEIALTEIQKVETKYSLSFSEDEISYVALYFESAIEKYKAKKTHSISIAIICGTGQTLSSIIENRLRRSIPTVNFNIEKLSYGEYLSNKNLLSGKMIISTIPIIEESLDENIFYLDISNFEQNFSKIKKIIKSHKNKNSISLFEEKNILYLQEELSKLDLLNRITKSLELNDFVKNGFLEEVLKREEISNTLLDNVLAIPHPISNHLINKSTIFVVVAPRGVKWDKINKTKFIFLIAIKTSDIKNVEYIYERILRFTGSPSLQDELLKSPMLKTVEKIFKV